MSAPTRMANVLSLLGALLATSLVMGLLAAGLVLPAVGASGQATKRSIAMFNDLPGEFEVNPLQQQSRILATNGSVLATPYDENRIVVPLTKISPLMQQAQVAIEDKRFYQHGGVDPQGLARAVASNVVSGGTQGASTLTQQYVKVIMQSSALRKGDKEAAREAVSQTGTEGYLRKLQQLKYSVSIEQKMTKPQILEGYLNTVYMGDQQYGVEAAARHYFNKTASTLTLSQAATLAGVVQRPGQTDPIHNPDAAAHRRNTVLDRMLEQKMITPDQHAQAKAVKLDDDLDVQQVDQSCATSKYPYFCYYVQEWLAEQPALGKDKKERSQTLRSGGLTIQTSLDPKKMAIIDKQLKAKVPVGNSADVQAAAVMIQPGTGLVQAMGQNTAYSNTRAKGKTGINYVVPPKSRYGGFSVGSAAKLFAITEALKQGRKIQSTVSVPKPNASKGESSFAKTHFTKQQFPQPCGLGYEGWDLGNDHEAKTGAQSLSLITGESINTAFAQLVSELGACKVWKTTGDFGVHHTDGKPIQRTPSSIVLGDNSSPLMLANAYATMAAGGKYCAPRPVISIKNSKGKALPLKIDACKQLVSPEVAAGVNKIFHAPLAKGGTAAKAALAGGRDAMGKTGTMNGAISTWFVGSTPQLTTAVWAGRAHDAPNGSKMLPGKGNVLVPMKDIDLPGLHTGAEYVYGGDLAAPMWKAMMDQALKGQPIKRFPQPPASMMGTATPTPGAQPASVVAPPADDKKDSKPAAKKKRDSKPKASSTPSPKSTPNPKPTKPRGKPTKPRFTFTIPPWPGTTKSHEQSASSEPGTKPPAASPSTPKPAVTTSGA